MDGEKISSGRATLHTKGTTYLGLHPRLASCF